MERLERLREDGEGRRRKAKEDGEIKFSNVMRMSHEALRHIKCSKFSCLDVACTLSKPFPTFFFEISCFSKMFSKIFFEVFPRFESTGCLGADFRQLCSLVGGLHGAREPKTTEKTQRTNTFEKTHENSICKMFFLCVFQALGNSGQTGILMNLDESR